MNVIKEETNIAQEEQNGKRGWGRGGSEER